MVKHIMLIILCLGVLSTVTGCYVEPSPYGTSSSGVYGSGVGAYQGEPYRDDEARMSGAERPYQRQWWEQDQGRGRDQLTFPYHDFSEYACGLAADTT